MRNISFVTDLHDSIGGCQIQMSNWKKHLNTLGFNVTSDAYLGATDIVHAFPITYPQQYEYLLNCKQPVVVSTNYWGELSAFRMVAYRAANYLSKFPLQLNGIVNHTARYKLFKRAKILIANSNAEKRTLTNVFEVKPEKIKIVKNSISSAFLEAAYTPSEKSEYILQIGSVSSRKGQRYAAELAKRLGVRLVLVGTTMDAAYLKDLKADYGTVIDYRGVIENGSAEMISLIDLSLACVLISKWETPGIVNLEAASRGIPVITTHTGGCEEYLGEYAFYCEQNTEIDYSAIIDYILNDKKNQQRRDRALSFNYKSAIEHLVSIYDGISS